MKYFGLLYSGFWRKPFRTTLTLLCIMVAFVLFGLLHGVDVAFDRAVDQFAANRLQVLSNEGFGAPLPVSYAYQIARLPDVTNVLSVAYLDAYFRDPRNSIAVVAVDSARSLTEASEITIAKDQSEAFARARTGAIIERRLAKKYGWHIGDQIPLISSTRTRDGNNAWTFDIVGIFDTSNGFQGEQMWIHYDYFDEARKRGKGTVFSFAVFTTDPSRNAQVASAIDRLFVNSANPTSTQSDRDYLRTAADWGDFSLMLTGIVSASLFTLLLVTANTMAESVRQRIPELAVLKALGFSDTRVLALVVIEAVALYIPGMVAGLAASTTFFPFISGRTGTVPIPMPASVLVQGCLIALVAALVSAAAPALRAARLPVAHALMRR
jgi:putative ABC transport system permease protein